MEHIEKAWLEGFMEQLEGLQLRTCSATANSLFNDAPHTAWCHGWNCPRYDNPGLSDLYRCITGTAGPQAKWWCYACTKAWMQDEQLIARTELELTDTDNLRAQLNGAILAINIPRFINAQTGTSGKHNRHILSARWELQAHQSDRYGPGWAIANRVYMHSLFTPQTITLQHLMICDAYVEMYANDTPRIYVTRRWQPIE
jgi:hypothetical protein